MKKINTISFLLCLSVIAVLGGFVYYVTQEKKKRVKSIQEAPLFKTATITDVQRKLVRKVRYHRFYFEIDNDTDYRNIKRNKIYIDKNEYADFIGKKFPVVYSAAYPEDPTILILESDFDKYNLRFPDSLRWVTNYKK